jgi:hypothetical protein
MLAATLYEECENLPSPLRLGNSTIQHFGEEK